MQDSSTCLYPLFVLQFSPLNRKEKKKSFNCRYCKLCLGLRDQQIRWRDGVCSSTAMCSWTPSILSQKLRSILFSLLHHDSVSAPYNSAGRFWDASWCLTNWVGETELLTQTLHGQVTHDPVAETQLSIPAPDTPPVSTASSVAGWKNTPRLVSPSSSPCSSSFPSFLPFS